MDANAYWCDPKYENDFMKFYKQDDSLLQCLPHIICSLLRAVSSKSYYVSIGMSRLVYIFGT